MKMIFIIAPLIIVLFIYWNRKAGKEKVHKIKLAEVMPYILSFYVRGLNQSGIIISLPKRTEFVQFGKFLNGKKIVVHFVYPIIEWSEKYIQSVKKLLKENGFQFKIESNFQCHEIEEIIVEFSDEVEKMVFLTRMVFGEIYGIKQDDYVKLWFLNLHPDKKSTGNVSKEIMERFEKIPTIAETNAHHWGLQIGIFVGSWARFLFKRNK